MSKAPQTSLLAALGEVVADAFEAESLPRGLGQVTVSDRPDLGHFQCNGAMAAARIAKQAPRQIAERIVARIRASDLFSEVSIAGPGFINLSVGDAVLDRWANAILADTRSGVGKALCRTIILDFGGPNIAKPMHVGHLRSSISGESRQRWSCCGDGGGDGLGGELTIFPIVLAGVEPP